MVGPAPTTRVRLRAASARRRPSSTSPSTAAAAASSMRQSRAAEPWRECAAGAAVPRRHSAAKQRTPTPPATGETARPRHGTGLEPDGVAGRKQATARRPTQPAAVAHRRSAQTLCSLMIFACNQASSTVLELQRDTSATASGAGHGVRRRAPWTRPSLYRCSSTGGPPHLCLRPALVARTAERLQSTASCTLGQRARVGALAIPAALFVSAQRPCR